MSPTALDTYAIASRTGQAAADTPIRILVVDDEEVLRDLLCQTLLDMGCEVIQASSAEEAWELIQQKPVHFLISDWMMEKMEGPELIQLVRQHDGFDHYVYTILLTARRGSKDIVTGLESGADDYLTKPFDLNELEARVNIGIRILTLEGRLRQALQRVDRLASWDPVTELLNRSALTRRADEEWERCARGSEPISLIMLDIDHFKRVNDQYGHLVGDEALRRVGELIHQTVRSYDIVGRWGGEEFLLVLPEVELVQAQELAERICVAIQQTPLELSHDEPIHVTISAGVASGLPATMPTFNTLLGLADAALYDAKNAGRNRVRTAENMATTEAGPPPS